LTFVLLAAGIVTVGWFYYRKSAQHYRVEVERQLSAIADLKVGDLTQWRKERQLDGGLFFKNPSFATLVRRFFEKPSDTDAQRQLLDWLGKYPAHDNYNQVRLLDAQGVSRLDVPAGQAPSAPVLVRAASEVLRSGQMAIQDFYRNEHDQRIYLAVLVPIFDEQAGSRPLGVLVLRTNPETYLYPFIKRWPTPSKTAETLLVRREGNEVVFLNELRFQTNTALTLHVPLDRVTMPAVQAALGRDGVMEGVDYRGVPVVSALRAIPDSPWALVARMDAAEVYTPLRAQLWQVAVMIGALLFGAGSCVGLVWRQQRVRVYWERVQSVEALRTSEGRLNFALQTIRTGAWELDLVNQTAQRTLIHDQIFGYATLLPQWTFEMFLKHVLPEDRPGVDRSFREATTKQTDWSFECRIRRADGEVRWIWAAGSHQRNAEGKPVRMSGIVQDITERKQTEDKIHTLNAELEQRVVERTAQLDAANKELEAFSYSVSHDLRAPLRHVQGYVDMLGREAEGRLSEKGRHYMKTIVEATLEMGVLIDDLLAFSRMGRGDMAETEVNLDTLVQDALRDVKPSTRERNIVWKIHPLPAVQADPAMLKLVLVNLLSNAVKFTRPRDPAVIEIGVVNEEDKGQKAPGSSDVTDHCSQITFFVRDNGVGFDPQYAHKLFGVFQRLHRAEQFEGTGIGLANVRRIIARHGGRTWAEGKINEGATFYFTLKTAH